MEDVSSLMQGHCVVICSLTEKAAQFLQDR